MAQLSDIRRRYLIELLERGENIPLDYKQLLFPPERQEYELVYAGKEREEDIRGETMAVPLQAVRTFGSTQTPDDQTWTNKLIFGDNLQILKTLLQMKNDGLLVNADNSYGVKLVYIDPPFGTGDEYGPSNGEISYTAKVQGARFIEFLRKRLVFLRELLADNGTIFVRLDYHFGHYVKVVMDEVFGEQNFRNEIVINRVKRNLKKITRLNVSTESLFFYSKTSDYYFNNPISPRVCNFCGREKEPIWDDLTSPGLRNPPERTIIGKMYLPRRGRHFTYIQKNIDDMTAEGRIRINEEEYYYDLEGSRIEGRPEYLQTESIAVDTNWTDIKGYAFGNEYPTENHEELLQRVISMGSADNDIVLDAFAGSGTTLAVAEKLGRRWIGIDCGKLSIYTIQRRFLNLREKIGNKGRKLSHKPFTLYNAGLYDFSKLKRLPWKDWRFFALHLFQCRNEPHKISGVDLDGYRGTDDVLVFNHLQDGGVVLDYGFIDDLHNQVGGKVGSRFFIIAPAASVSFLEDYIEKGDTKYYVLRIPYSIINELHRRDFEANIQPIDETQINETVEAVGFDFMRLPEVVCDYLMKLRIGELVEDPIVRINTFRSKAMIRGASELENMASLAMVLVDLDYDGEVFSLDIFFYANEIKANGCEFRLPLGKFGVQIMLIYIDIYGNEYKEIKTKNDFIRVIDSDGEQVKNA